MRKVMLLAAMLAMALAAAAPVIAQTSVVNIDIDQSGTVDDSVCSQVYNIAVQQYNAGDQNATANASAFADASAGPFGIVAAAAIAEANAVNIANAVGIDVNTVNYCLNNVTTVAAEIQYKKTVTPTAKTVWPKKTVTPKATAHAKKKVVWIKGKKFFVVEGKTVTATAKATATVKSGSIKTLPETGGASLLALGAGALLVGGGLVARRLAR